MSKIVAVVPMKLTNRRFPGKNTKAFTNGKPLCYYILSTLLEVKEIDSVFVYCSDEHIKEYLPEGVQYLKRDTFLDQDTTKMNEVLKRFSEDVFADVYVMTHATAPFVTGASIRRGIEAVSGGEYDSSFAVRKVQDFLWKDGKPMNYSLESIPRTQDLAAIYAETSGFYIYEREVIQRMGRRIGERPFMVEVSAFESIDIDEEEDFEFADAIFNYRRMRRK